MYNSLGQNNMMSVISQLKAAQDPQKLLNDMATNNKQIADVLKEIEQHNGDAKATFYDQVSKMGINPDVILRLIR